MKESLLATVGTIRETRSTKSSRAIPAGPELTTLALPPFPRIGEVCNEWNPETVFAIAMAKETDRIALVRSEPQQKRCHLSISLVMQDL